MARSRNGEITQALTRARRQISGRFTRHGGDSDVPAGALIIARRLADEGYDRADVSQFLADNFRRIDVAAAVERIFGREPVGPTES